MKIQINIKKQHLLLVIAVIAVTAIGIVLASAPNPGHTFGEIEIPANSITSTHIANSACTITTSKVSASSGTGDDACAATGSACVVVSINRWCNDVNAWCTVTCYDTIVNADSNVRCMKVTC